VDPGDVVLKNTIFDQVLAAGKQSGVYLGKSRIRHLAREENTSRLLITNDGTSDTLIKVLRSDIAKRGAAWDLTMLHLTEPDTIGHLFGWMSPEYFLAVAKSDRDLGLALNAILKVQGDDEIYVIVTSDHGGHGLAHADPIPAVFDIPWICAGPGIPPFGSIGRRIGAHDTASTTLSLLGLEVPASYEGDVVEEIFSEGNDPFLRGDANTDGQVDLSDGVLIFSYLFLGTARLRCFDAADTLDTGRINVTSGIYLLNFLFSGGTPPPAPFGTCETDPTDDKLRCGNYPAC
ncbi:MAG: alkaline phosphatase family protein, partial [Planctomycetota bacterium]